MRHALTLFLLILCPLGAQAANGCAGLPSHSALKEALVAAKNAQNGGLGMEMWGALVDRSGVVCAVAYTGNTVDAQWPGSRAIAAQKANTANAFSVKNNALSTANLYAGTQPGGFLFGLQESNPVNTDLAYKGEASSFGSARDPMVGGRIGGVNVFGGGLALYNRQGDIVGGLGTSGDTSCADHNISWRTRHALGLDFIPSGVSRDKDDQIIYDVRFGKSSGGFGHPSCGMDEADIVSDLPKVRRVAASKAPAAE